MLISMKIKVGGTVVGTVKRHLAGPRMQWDFSYRFSIPAVTFGHKYAKTVSEIRNIILSMFPDATFEYSYVGERRLAA